MKVQSESESESESENIGKSVLFWKVKVKSESESESESENIGKSVCDVKINQSINHQSINQCARDRSSDHHACILNLR
eukprot:COSAG02_NODE_1165_length_14156_cov_58.567191_10_plen_78_part_00